MSLYSWQSANVDRFPHQYAKTQDYFPLIVLSLLPAMSIILAVNLPSVAILADIYTQALLFQHEYVQFVQ